MPVPEERLYRPDRINRWFAVSSVVMTVCLFWMIQVDYDRPWREYQDHYYLTKAAIAHLDYLDAMRDENVNEREKAKRELDDARQYVQQMHGDERARIQHALAEADLEFKKASDPWSRVRQLLDVTKARREALLAELGPNHPNTKAAEAELQAQLDELEEWRKKKEQWEDKKKELEKQLAEIEEPITVAEKRLRDLEKVREDALQKDMQYRGVLTDEGLFAGIPVVSAIINAPLLDFVAPKNTPGRHQVNQLVVYDVKQRLNYLEGYTTDRCTTCHVAIDDPAFSMENLARKLERSLPGINEALTREGKTALPLPAPPAMANGSALEAGKVTEYWHLLTSAQRKEYFESLKQTVNQYLKQTDRKTIELGEPLLAHPDLPLYVSVDSPHPMAKMGCTVCHEGNPEETDFVTAGHLPATHEVEHEWEEHYYIRNLGVPAMTFATMEHYWDRPMLLPQYTEASCSKCHDQVADISRFEGERHGTKLNLGRFLFTNVGCANCHEVQGLSDARRVGPDLSHVASKLEPGFVQQWVFFPQKFRPSTRMPHFFMQENNGLASANELDPEPVLRTETEVAAITQYLFAMSKPWQPLTPAEGVTGDAERGRELFRSVGCLACHANLQEYGEEWITRDLMEREDLDQETAFHRYRGMTYEQRVMYAMEHFPGEEATIFDPETARFDPARGYTPPTFSRFAPELSGIGSKVSEAWLYSWLKEPRHYSGETKMPSLRLSDQEAMDLAAYLATLTNESFQQGDFPADAEHRQMAERLIIQILATQRSERRSHAIYDDEGGELTDMIVAQVRKSLGEETARQIVSSMDLEQRRMVFLGSKMITHYGCYACHTIPGFEETSRPGTELTTWAEKPIAQLDFAFFDVAFDHVREEKPEIFGNLYRPEDSVLNHWSPGENPKEQITHTHQAFARHKMLNPRIWDREKIKGPYDKLKMPNFYFTEEEATALTTYLLSRRPARVTEALKVDYDTDVEGPVARGRHLTRELNCVGCHQVEDNAPTIQHYYKIKPGDQELLDATNAPPSLVGEGAKLQHQWFHSFLKNVEPLRPWLRVRMPSFYLTNEQATVLVQYFAALSQADSQKLAKALSAVDEHLVGAGESAADWFEEESLERRAEALRAFAVERKLMRDSSFDVLSVSEESLRQAHADLLTRVRFIKDLYDVHYPFVEPPRPLSDEERFALGGRFFNDMGCLNCHVLGNMLTGPATTTDDFVQMYRLDGVGGEGENARAILNGRPYPVGAQVDGFTIVSATNLYNATGDVTTTAVVEGPNAAGETEQITLKAPSAPNLSLTYRRLRRDWVYDWMLNPQWIQPGTKMPQNFVDGKSPFEGSPEYPGASEDHINLLVDYLYDAGTRSTRAPLKKLVVPKATDEVFEEDAVFED